MKDYKEDTRVTGDDEDHGDPSTIIVWVLGIIAAYTFGYAVVMILKDIF